MTWRADSLEAMSAAPYRSWEASHLDWGDNLESRSWTTNSIIRVETTPYATLPGGSGDPSLQRGYQMWHVSGKGTDELWGMRTTENEVPLPFVYDSPYAIVHTSVARLSMTKIGKDPVTCPVTGADPGFELTWDANPSSGTYLTWQGDEACEVRDTPYTPELNIGGRFVYGYNWNLRREPGMCSGFNKAGWWRLTFYTAPDADTGYRPALFAGGASIVLAPPVLPVAAPIVAVMAPAELEGSEGALYKPVIDAGNHLTYIDICVKPR